MRIKLSATVPVVTYGNVVPEFEVEAESIEEGLAIVEPELKKFWNKYVEQGKQLPEQGELLTDFFGNQIYYDDASHTYTWNGERYLSGSEYAKQFEKPFDAQAISKKMADKAGVDAEDILAMWKLNSEVSMGFGTAIHAAIEMYGRYQSLTKALGSEKHIHAHPVIKKAVEEFYEASTGEYEHEVLVVDHESKRAGRIDLLRITGDKKCVIEDIKTNADIKKDLVKYWEQLKFYRGLFEANGWVVEDLIIHHFNGDWDKLTYKEKEK